MTLRVFITFFTAFNPLGLEGSNQERGRCCAVSKGYYWNQRLSPEQDAPSALSPFKIMLNLIQGNRQCCREWRWCAGCSLGLGEEVWQDGVPKNLFVHLMFTYCFWSGDVCGQMVALEKKQHIFYNPQDPVLLHVHCCDLWKSCECWCCECWWVIRSPWWSLAPLLLRASWFWMLTTNRWIFPCVLILICPSARSPARGSGQSYPPKLLHISFPWRDILTDTFLWVSLSRDQMMSPPRAWEQCESSSRSWQAVPCAGPDGQSREPCL